MKKIMVIAASALILLSCAGTPEYVRAEKPGEYGYYDSRVQDNIFRVSFKGKVNTHPTYIKNFLLFRCAELTVESGYQYFMIIEYDLISEDVLVTDTIISKGYNDSDPEALTVPTIDSVTVETKAKEMEVMYLIQLLSDPDAISEDLTVFNALEILRNMDPLINAE